MSARTIITSPLRRWIPRIFTLVWFLAQAVFGVLAFSAPRFVVDQDLSALMMDIPKADRSALLVPIRLAFLQINDSTSILLPNDDATIVIRHLTDDPETLNTDIWTTWLVSQLQTHYASLEAFQREVITASLTKIEAQQAAVNELAADTDPFTWTLQLNAGSLQSLQNLYRREDAMRLRLEALDTVASALADPQIDDVQLTISDRTMTLVGLQVIIGLCGLGLAGWLTKRFSA